LVKFIEKESKINMYREKLILAIKQCQSRMTDVVAGVAVVAPSH